MMTNYRELLGISKLTDACGISKDARDTRQKKAIQNIKYCAEDQWQFVNSWYDNRDEISRAHMMDAKTLFSDIYSESQKSVFREGSVHFGAHCESYLKDIRFCGAKFLKQVSLYYTAKLLEDSVPEVEGTEEDAQRVLRELTEIRDSIQ